MTISAAIARMQALANACSDVQSAPSVATESISDAIFAVSYATSGRIAYESSGFALAHPTIVTEFHVPATSLTDAIPIAELYLNEFPAKLMADPTLNGTVQHIKETRFEFGKLKFGAMDTVGVRFETDVKLQVTA
jgi:hypothetical protein